MRLRAVILGALCLLLAAPVAGADDTPAPLDVRNFDLLPLNDLERGEFARDHPELAQRVAVLAKRVQKLRAHRAARKDPQDDGGRRIAEQIHRVEQELAPLVAQALKALEMPEIDGRLLRHVAAAPSGPYRVARYAMGLVLYVEGLPAESRALLAGVLPRVDGALLVLHGRRARLLTSGKQGGLTKDQRDALVASLDEEVRGIEKRWWRLVDYVVPEAQRAAIHRVLPRAYQQHETVIQHVYALPGLTAPQGVRIRAMLEEVQAESSPDNAAVKRLQGEARDPKTPNGRKPGLQKEIGEAQGRLLELTRWAVEESRRILTPAQWQALEAIPPRVSHQDRQATSVDLLRTVQLTPAQRERLTSMRKELAPHRRAFQERRLKTAAKSALMGPDSPKMAGMQMEMANIQAEGNVLQRRFNGRVLQELLTPEQVASWVLVAPDRSR
ncbi:MAG: hypothetical protein QNJ90_08810 [Planctomycetota bacterium]|nr:hypothetical protein [Planctomycetota bacterium]